MVISSNAAAAFDVVEREMYKLKKLTDPAAILAQELVCANALRAFFTASSDEPYTAADAEVLESVRELRQQMDTDPAWQDEAPSAE